MGSSISDEMLRDLRWITVAGATLSSIGTLAIVINYALFPKLRTTPYLLVTFLAISDLGSSAAYFIGIGDVRDGDSQFGSSASCLIAAGVTQFFDLSTFLWTVTVACCLYLILVRRFENKELRPVLLIWHIINWGIPAIFLAIAAGIGALGDAGMWCWIKAEYEKSRMLLYYGPLLGVIAVTGVFYVLVWHGVDAPSPAQRTAVLRRMGLYLGVFTFTRIWSISNRFQQLDAGPDGEPVKFLVYMHVIFSPLQGLMNAAVYGINRRVIDEYKERCQPLATFLTCGSQRGGGVTIENPVLSGARTSNKSVANDLRGIRLSLDGRQKAPVSRGETISGGGRGDGGASQNGNTARDASGAHHV